MLVPPFQIKHPDQEQDFEENSDQAKNALTHDFWKSQWDIPTLAERRAILETSTTKDPYAFMGSPSPTKKKSVKGKKSKKLVKRRAALDNKVRI